MDLYCLLSLHNSLTGALCFSWRICITIWSHQLPSRKPPFRISCKVNLLAIKFLQVLRLELAPQSDSNSYFFCRELQSSPCLWIASLSRQKSLSHCSVPLSRGGSHWSFPLASPSLETTPYKWVRVRVIRPEWGWSQPTMSELEPSLCTLTRNLVSATQCWKGWETQWPALPQTLFLLVTGGRRELHLVGHTHQEQGFCHTEKLRNPVRSMYPPICTTSGNSSYSCWVIALYAVLSVSHYSKYF